MTYLVAWNESSPAGTVSAATLDTELQNLKISIRERMNQILSNAWETDASDPKTIAATSSESHSYNADTATETANGTAETLMVLQISGSTDSSGDLIVDFDNLTGTPTASEWDFVAGNAFDKNAEVDTPTLDVTNNTLGFRLTNRLDGTALISFASAGVRVLLRKNV